MSGFFPLLSLRMLPLRCAYSPRSFSQSSQLRGGSFIARSLLDLNMLLQQPQGIGPRVTLIRADIREYLNAVWDRQGLITKVGGPETRKSGDSLIGTWS